MSDSSKRLGSYSFGVGDRFAQEAIAQLRAFQDIARRGATVVPVWNKSNREHLVVGTEPRSVRAAADEAVAALAWQPGHFVDADHVTLATVDRFIEDCDFFTLDVSSQIGAAAESEAIDAFLGRHPELTGRVAIAGLDVPLDLTRAEAARYAAEYLRAVAEAGRIFRHVSERRSGQAFLTEVSLDETAVPQSPKALLVVLAALADEGVPAATIAPRFSGRFNKGVDYAGDAAQFEREFDADVAVVAHAVAAYELPNDLKLSIHSGSDKFSLFPAIRRTLRARRAGVHVKTSGTTWLEELIGLSEAGPGGLALAKDVYRESFARREELCGPYAEVIDIHVERLPSPDDVQSWTGAEFAGALRHDPESAAYSADVRQLLHVGYKVAAEMGERYMWMLRECRTAVERNVTQNLIERHLRPLFLDE